MGRVLPAQRRVPPQVGEALGHAAVVQHRHRLLHDPAEVTAGTVETAIDQRLEQRLLARTDRLRQTAVLQFAQQRDGLGDPGQRGLGVAAREARHRIVHQAADLSSKPGIELAHQRLAGLQAERVVVPEAVKRRRHRRISGTTVIATKQSQRRLSCKKRAFELLMSRTLK